VKVALAVAVRRRRFARSIHRPEALHRPPNILIPAALEIDSSISRNYGASAPLAAQIVVEGATLIVAGDQPRAMPVFTDLAPLMIGGVAIGYQILWIVAISAVVIAAVMAFFRYTLIGKAMRACSINREAAALQAIPVRRKLALSFALSAGLGALAGVLITPTQYTAFNVGVPYAISGFIAAIVGGFGKPLGALLGGLMLGVAQAGAIAFLGSGMKNVAALSMLLLFLFVRPGGVLGAAK
jgi:branched-chain amino acid transport system permease protein